MDWNFLKLDSKWAWHYVLLMEKAMSRIQPDGYVEEHHVWPRSLGGTDARSNLVRLTAREHLVAHKLLVRSVPKSSLRKMQMALWAMLRMKSFSTKDRRVPASRDFEAARKLIVAAKTGVPRDHETREKISKSLREHFAKNGSHNAGRTFDHLTQEERDALFGSKNRGRRQSQEEKDKRAEKNRGKKRSPEVREKMRLAAIKREANKREANKREAKENRHQAVFSILRVND